MGRVIRVRFENFPVRVARIVFLCFRPPGVDHGNGDRR
jgi:hypothetical protein